MPVWVGPVSDEVLIGSVLPDGREVLEVRLMPSIGAIVSNHHQRRGAARHPRWNMEHPENPTGPPASEEPVRFARVCPRTCP